MFSPQFSNYYNVAQEEFVKIKNCFSTGTGAGILLIIHAECYSTGSKTAKAGNEPPYS
jgi:ribosomal protein S27AE